MLLLLITIAGCQTIDDADVATEITLPETPERKEIRPPPEEISVADSRVKKWVAETLVYYNDLVSKWENWSSTVKEILKE